LRLADNPALLSASETGAPVLPVFILDDSAPVRRLGGAGRWWLDKSLRSLARDLESLGLRLILRRGAAGAELQRVVAETGATGIFWNRLYDPGSVLRDRGLKRDLHGAGIACQSFNASLLTEPWDVKTGAGGPFRVFSAFWRVAGPRSGLQPPFPAPTAVTAHEGDVASDNLDDWALHPRAPDWSEGFADWRPGETGATSRLDAFISRAVSRYAEGRNRPDQESTSRLSPHLRFGEIGPRQVWAAAEASASRGADRRAVETFQKELGWREFNAHLMFNFPDTLNANLNPRFDAFPWRNAPDDLSAWRNGLTGYPIVDAGMRQLWRTGWMHNRVRMIVASFLIKDLLIDWRLGEDWFWDTLVDADIASNVGGWQWVAGSGADAAPYFRVFNPVLQGERFDPEGDYVRRWAPELAGLSNAHIHAPWTADEETLRTAGVRLGETYPAPIVDHSWARDRALELFEALP
jgi:deoxyribodipyrimidine photo-lyase